MILLIYVTHPQMLKILFVPLIGTMKFLNVLIGNKLPESWSYNGDCVSGYCRYRKHDFPDTRLAS